MLSAWGKSDKAGGGREGWAADVGPEMERLHGGFWHLRRLSRACCVGSEGRQSLRQGQEGPCISILQPLAGTREPNDPKDSDWSSEKQQ